MTPPAGVYVHVPFCVRKCTYCAFYSVPSLDLKARWLAALKREVGRRADPGLDCDSIYIGGGTPSLLDPDEVGSILGAVRASFRVSQGAEVSLESNPGTVDRGKLAGFREAGVNRLAVGAQSLDEDDLRFLGRIHTTREVREAIDGARLAGFSNLGLDLISGIPGRDEAHWEGQMEQAAALAPEHVSCYALGVEERTPLAARVRDGLVRLQDEDQARSMFLLTLRRMAGLGYPFYEVSNFARTEALRCRHNWKYWTGARYVGLGPAAHSFTRPERRWNAPDLAGYVEALESDTDPPGALERLKPHQLALESLYLGMRTADGVDLAAVEMEHCPGFRAVNAALLEWLEAQGLALMDGPRLRLTPDGLAVGDSVAPMFDCGECS